MKIREYIVEEHDVITKPDESEAFKKYGFWLSPYETVYINGVKHYRVIYPAGVGNSGKGGWATDYSMPKEAHIKADAHINTLKHSKANAISEDKILQRRGDLEDVQQLGGEIKRGAKVAGKALFKTGKAIKREIQRRQAYKSALTTKAIKKGLIKPGRPKKSKKLKSENLDEIIGRMVSPSLFHAKRVVQGPDATYAKGGGGINGWLYRRSKRIKQQRQMKKAAKAPSSPVSEYYVLPGVTKKQKARKSVHRELVDKRRKKIAAAKERLKRIRKGTHSSLV